MSDPKQQRSSAHDALVVAVGTARLAGWAGLLAGMGTLVYAAIGPDKPAHWWTIGIAVLCFGITWSLIARIAGALGAMVGR